MEQNVYIEHMSSWKKLLHKLALKTESSFDSLKIRLYERMGSDREALIIPYNSFGTGSHIYIKGRVLRNKNIAVRDDDSLWENLMNSYKRMGSSEIPYAQVQIQYGNQSWELTCDDEGYYEGELKLDQTNLQHPEKAPIAITLLNPIFSPLPTFNGFVFNPPQTADFGVISDIDDTIMETGATSFQKMAVLTFLKNVHGRIAFSKVPEFYHGLRKGPSGANNNPFYYVSSSPWNLYDLITDFIELNQIPMGPLFLRDLGLDEEKFITKGHGDHKTEQITRLLELFPQRQYILIGDSGQQDAFIYYRIAQRYPERILAVYIRNAQAKETFSLVKEQIEKAQAEGIEMMMMEDSQAGIDHALKLRLIV